MSPADRLHLASNSSKHIPLGLLLALAAAAWAVWQMIVTNVDGMPVFVVGFDLNG